MSRTLLMRTIPAIAVAALGCVALAAVAAGIPRAEYKASRARIVAEYEADRQKCGAHLGHATELCVIRARGARKVAEAELEAAYKPGPRTHYDAAIARAEAGYAVAQKECQDQKGDARKACAKDAKAARVAARAAAAAARKKAG